VKRDQVEQVVRAALALLDIFGVDGRAATMHATRDERGPRVSVRFDNDADLHALAGDLGAVVHRHDFNEPGEPSQWYLSASTDVGPVPVRLFLSGPDHKALPAHVTDDNAIAAAIAQVNAATGGQP
jgi:hypothetical protein